MGLSVMLTIAANALGELSIFGFSIRNILCILTVLIMGWKNGMLVGATTGITVGTILGILNSADPIMLASYAISGMIAGLLNKLGKNRSSDRFHNRKHSSIICSKWQYSRSNQIPGNINCYTGIASNSKNI